jgi:hypothetical protein
MVFNAPLENDVCSFHGSNCDGECQDPNVDNGIMTKVWGPPGWLFLHSIAFGYPYAINPNNPKHVIRREATRRYFTDTGFILPCKYCRESYQDFIKQIPIDDNLGSRKSLTKWLYVIHNKVNDKLGVPKCRIPSFEEHTAEYEAFRAKCSKTTSAERINNMAKGCVVPADGTTKKCFLKVIKTKKGDITRRSNAAAARITIGDNDYIIMKKLHLALLFIAFTLIILLVIYLILRYMKPKTLKKLLNK